MRSLLGFTIGGGLEAKIADNWSARLEYLYFDYGIEVYPNSIVDIDIDIDIDIDVRQLHAVRFGTAYNF